MRPAVFLLRFNSGSTEEPQLSQLAVEKEKSDTTLTSAIFGQAVFSSTGKDVFVTAYPTLQDGRRLGLIYCTNKPSAVYRASVEEGSGGRVGDKDAVARHPWTPQRWTRLSSPGISARSPRATKGPQECIWLQCEEGGAHRDCDSLASYSHGQVRVEIPIVSTLVPQTDYWAGLYCDTRLPRSCTLKEGRIVVADTISGCSTIIVSHPLGSTSVPINLTPAGDDIALVQTARERSLIWSYKLLCTDGERALVAVRSSSLQPEQVLLGTLEQDGTKANWLIVRRLGQQWEQEEGEKNLPLCRKVLTDAAFLDLQRLNNLQCTVEEVQATAAKTKGDEAVQTIVIRKAASSGPGPCILVS